MTQHVNLGEVQGNVVRTYGKNFRWAWHGFFTAQELASERGLTQAAATVVSKWLSAVTFGDPTAGDAGAPSGDATAEDIAKYENAAFVNIAFTWKGLCALGVPDYMLQAFPQDFRDGAARRAKGLGDHWPGSDAIPLEDAHLMLIVHGRSKSGRDKRWSELQEINSPSLRPLRLVHQLKAGFEKNPRERFGFADGLSQPAIAGVDIDAVGDGVFAGVHPREPRWRRKIGLVIEDLGLRPLSRNWRLIRTGEFLLGYENEDGAVPVGSDAPLGPNSTFMVYREMDQDVSGFNDYLAKHAKRLAVNPYVLGAKIVGRWANGTPAVRSEPDPDELAGNRRRANDFLYKDDPSGYGCPLGAHTRRSNPRDALPGGAEETMRHRIIRRGMPYHSVKDKDGTDREGLAFICFSASIKNGFEFIQEHWINTGERFGLGNQSDFLLQQAGKATKMVIPGFRPMVLDPPEEPFVRVRGCEYLFVPSRTACTWLAQLVSKR